MQNEVDNSGIKGLEEQDLGTVTVNPNKEKTESAFPQFTDEAKEARGLEDFKNLKKGFKKALPYIGQLGLDLVPGSGITEIFGKQPDIVEGGQRPSFAGQVERTTELAKEGKTTEAVVSGVDTALTGVAGVGEGIMVAGAMTGPLAPLLVGAGFAIKGLAKGGKLILQSTKTGKKILANYDGNEKIGFSITDVEVPKDVESDPDIQTLEDTIDIPTTKTEDTDTEVAIPENIKELNSTEAITSYVIAPEDVNRNQLIAKIENDSEVKAKTDKYLEEKGFTEETVPVFRLITPNKKGAEIGEESLISGSLTPESNIATMRYFQGRGGGQKQLVRYDVPKSRIKLAMGGIKDDIKQSSNKIIKEKGIGQTEPKITMADLRAEAMGGGRLSSKVTNPSKTAKELIDMQDEVIADVTGLKKNVYEGNPNEIFANPELENITRGKYKNYKEMRSDMPGNRDFTTRRDIEDAISKKITAAEFEKIKNDRAKEAYDKVINFYKLDTTKQDEGIKALGPQNIKKRDRVGTTGQYIGAPKGLDSPQKLSSIRRKLKTLAVGGQEGRYWYEKSGKEILEATGGNVDEADKIIQAIAITSPQTPIKANFDFAIQAYNQYKAGQPIKTGRFPSAMVPKLEEVFAGKNWEGRKTDDFYNNLMVHIDPDRVGPVTGDIWMLRALGFAKENEMPSPEQYKFVTKEIQKLSKQLGWQPQQTQAAIWVNFKARSENPDVKKRTMEKSLKKGFIKYEKNNKGKNVVKYLNKPEHLKLWFKESFAYEPTAADIKKAGFDYSQALKESLGQISWEAVPHSSTNHLKGLETGEPKIKAEYHTEISKAFLDDKGRDIIAQRLGLLSPGEFEAPGYYKGIVNPGSQTEVVMPKGYKTGKTNKIEKSTEDLIQAYAIARGILMKQEMVGWHRPFFNPVIKEANGVDLNLGRQFNLNEIGELSQEIQKVVDKEVKLIRQTNPDFKGPSFEIAPVSTTQGVRLINFEEVFDNQQFQKIILEANENFAKKLDNESSINVELFSAQKGDYSNNWSEYKNGEGYLQRISKEGQSDLYRKVRSIIDEIQPRIDDVDRDFSERYGFNFNSEINSAYRGEGQLDEGVRVTVDDTPTATTDPTSTRPEPQTPIKKSYGGFVERNTYDWVYLDG